MNIFDYNVDFYPTPKNVIEKMLMGEEISGKVFLEPSAGKGNIVDYLKANGASEVIACENDPICLKLLRNKCNIVKEDFLDVTAEMVSHVNQIVMNPPFSNAAKHILHAYEIAPSGCTITALCNSDSFNRYNSTKANNILKEKVELYGMSEELYNCFENAERKTNVCVTLIKLYKTGSGAEEFDDYLFSKDNDDFLNKNEEEGVIPYNLVRELVNRYIEAVKLFDSTQEAARKINDIARFGENSYLPLAFEAVTGNGKVCKTVTHDFYKKELQKYYWRVIFNKLNMEKYATSQLHEQINKFVEQQTNVPFTMHNVYKLIEIVIKTTGCRMQTALVEAFELICSFSAENSTAAETWKTNANYMVNKKFIVPYMTRFEGGKWGPEYNVKLTWSGNLNKIEDVCKAICFITGVCYDDIPSLDQYVHNQSIKWGTWFDWAFWRCKAFKKGTMHFEFKSEEVWFKFNQEVAKTKGWNLPKKAA